MRRYLLFLLNPLFIGMLLAHPHVFIDYTIDFVFDQNGLIGIKAEWFFDEMYSGGLLQNYDTDMDGQISAAEAVDMERDAFSGLIEYNYFTYITSQHKCYRVKKVSDFSVEVTDNRIVYRYFIPYKIPAVDSAQDIEVCIYDETYYVDLWPLNDDPARFTNAEMIDYEYKVFEDEKETQGYGQIYPFTTRLTFKRKP